MTTSTGTGSSSTGGDPLAECEALGFGFPSGQWSTGLPAEVCFGAEAAERDLVFRIDGEDYDMVEFMPDGGGACIAPYTWTLQMPPNIDAPAGAELSLGFYSGGGGVELAVCTVGIQ